MPDDYTDFGGMGLPGALDTDAGNTGRGAAGAVDYFAGFGDLWGDFAQGTGEIATGYTSGGPVGAARALAPYATSQKRGTRMSARAARQPPPLDTSIPFTLDGGNMADDFVGTDTGDVDPGNALTYDQKEFLPLGSLMSGSGISARKAAYLIRTFGLAVIPYLASFVGATPQLLLAAYMRFKGTRRRRGLSSRDIQNTKRVLRTFDSMRHALGRAFPGRGGAGGGGGRFRHRRRG